jgi:hypothetical protein
MATILSKAEQMSALINLWRESGLTKKSFCASQNINLHTLTYWIDKERQGSDCGGFVEVVTESSPSYVEFLFPQGAVMRLGTSVSSAHISLLKTLLY